MLVRVSVLVMYRLKLPPAIPKLRCGDYRLQPENRLLLLLLDRRGNLHDPILVISLLRGTAGSGRRGKETRWRKALGRTPTAAS